LQYNATGSNDVSPQLLLAFLLSQYRVAMPSATIQAIDSAVIIGFTPAPHGVFAYDIAIDAYKAFMSMEKSGVPNQICHSLA